MSRRALWGLAAYVFSRAGGGGGRREVIDTGNTVVLTAISSEDLDAVIAGFVADADRVIADPSDENLRSEDHPPGAALRRRYPRQCT